jgi:hypothetical protein
MRNRAAFVALLLLLSCRPVAAGSVILTWDRNVEPDVVGYLLLSGAWSGTYTSSVNVGNTTTWTVSGLEDGQLVTAFDVLVMDSFSGAAGPLEADASTRRRRCRTGWWV